MARKVVNRRELRDQVQAAEAAEAAKAETAGEPAAKAAKKKAKRKSRAKEPVEERKRLFWGVFTQAMKCVARFDFSQREEAQKKADDLSTGGKNPHFIQKIKEVIEE